MFGGKAVRLSVADERGQEYFMIVPKPDRGWLDRDGVAGERSRCLDMIAEAIESGLPPGEVRLVNA